MKIVVETTSVGDRQDLKEGGIMRKLFIAISVFGLVVALCTTVLCEEKKQEPVQPEAYGRGWGPGPRMDYGWGPGSGMGSRL